MSSAILSAITNEDILIDRAIRGDLDAFNHLVEAYQDIAFNHAWIFLKDRYLAEDVTQESFIKAYTSLGRFQKGSFRAWLLRIVANTSYDVLRKNKRQKIFPLFPEDDEGNMNENPKWITDSSPSVEKTVEQKETRSEIYRLLDDLPKIYRETLILIDIYDFEYKEAAQVLNLKVGTVKSRLARARMQMRTKLKINPDYQIPADSLRISQPKTNEQKFEPSRQFLHCHT